jgi:hypothetical protein
VTWRKQLLENADTLFERGRLSKEDPEAEVRTLHQKIGQLTMEGDLLSQALSRSR